MGVGVVGSTRFNDLRRGVPRMSPALLLKRLKELGTRMNATWKCSKVSPGRAGAFLYCRRQLFANALMAGLARPSWRAKGQSREAFRRGLSQ
jgi:hypothetical protein